MTPYVVAKMPSLANLTGVPLAVNPHYAVYFLASHIQTAAIVLRAIFLAVTGTEALHVDLGHFGRKPIIVA